MTTGTLVIDRFEVHETPQSGSWLMGFKVSHPDGTKAIFHVPRKKYEGDGLLIEAINLKKPAGEQRVELIDVEVGTTIKWWMGLDDNEGDVMSNAEDQCEGSLVAKAKGTASYDEDDWDFSIDYHMEFDENTSKSRTLQSNTRAISKNTITRDELENSLTHTIPRVEDILDYPPTDQFAVLPSDMSFTLSFTPTKLAEIAATSNAAVSTLSSLEQDWVNAAISCISNANTDWGFTWKTGPYIKFYLGHSCAGAVEKALGVSATTLAGAALSAGGWAAFVLGALATQASVAVIWMHYADKGNGVAICMTLSGIWWVESL